jgi:hypothetical protein
MATHRKLTRMEANKEARRVLNRHSVDLSYCQFSCSGTELRLTGWLSKVDSSDFSAPMIEGMIHEFYRRLPGYTVVGDFDNWNFNSERITFLGDGQQKRGQGDSEEVTVYEINLDDYDFEAS